MTGAPVSSERTVSRKGRRRREAVSGVAAEGEKRRRRRDLKERRRGGSWKGSESRGWWRRWRRMIANTAAISERIMHERADCAAERGGDGEVPAGGGEDVASSLCSSSIGSIEELGGRGGRPIG